MDVRIEIHDEQAKAMLTQVDSRVRQAVHDAIWRGAEELARVAKRNAPTLFATLNSSIRAEQVGELHFRVATGVNYARAVEEGTGPAAGKKKYYPNPIALQQYLMQSPRMRGHKWAKAGSRKRGEQELDIWFRSRALAWYIYQHGTKPQPYMQPAFESQKDRIIANVQAAARRAAQAVQEGQRV